MADTIVALSTGALPSGVAIIRISGPAAGSLLATIGVKPAQPRRLHLAGLVVDGETVDRAMVAWFPGPHSFTGEDSAELHVHGSPAVVRFLLRHLAAQPGARLAEAGEFTRRAFENGKLDLTEVEGLGDLLAAETESQRRQALARVDGGLSRHIDGWRDRLLDLRAEVEAQLDFSDEGDVGALPVDFEAQLARLREDFEAAARAVDNGRVIREGLRVAIAGPPNVGKSSLLNALSRSDVAIVSGEAGTTRDVREVPMDLGGRLVLLIDMAGLRETESLAEAEGVRRARSEIERADLVLWLQAPGIQVPPAATTAPLWIVATKRDLGIVPADLSVSALTAEGLDTLLTKLNAFTAAASGSGELALVSRERDRAALHEAAAALHAAEREIVRPEVAAEMLRAASHALERLVGRLDAEQVLDRLFAGFCIGK